jgi:5-methylcytosine-specific restriction endonuclease McrA
LTYSIERLKRIFEKNNGYCFHCGKKLAWSNYGNLNGKAGWEVDHSIPKSRGGTYHLNNLVPSCIPCNREKGDLTSRQYRAILETDSDESENDPLSTIVVIGGTLLLLGWIKKMMQQSRPRY